MKQFILVRHTKVNVQPDRPAEQWQITSEGSTLIQQLVLQLKSYQPTAVVSSPYPKAQQTGLFIANNLDLSHEIRDSLREQNREGTPFLTQDLFLQKIHNLLTHPTELHYGQETGQAARNRIEAGIHQLMPLHQTPILVSHGTIMTLLITYYNPHLDPITFWQQMTLPAAFILTYPNFQLQTSIYM